MKADECSFAVMGEKLGRTQGAIQAQLRKLGIYSLPKQKQEMVSIPEHDDEDDDIDDTTRISMASVKIGNEQFLAELALHHKHGCGELNIARDEVIKRFDVSHQIYSSASSSAGWD